MTEPPMGERRRRREAAARESAGAPLSRRELRARERALETGALELDQTGALRVVDNPPTAADAQQPRGRRVAEGASTPSESVGNAEAASSAQGAAAGATSVVTPTAGVPRVDTSVTTESDAAPGRSREPDSPGQAEPSRTLTRRELRERATRDGGAVAEPVLVAEQSATAGADAAASEPAPVVTESAPGAAAQAAPPVRRPVIRPPNGARVWTRADAEVPPGVGDDPADTGSFETTELTEVEVQTSGTAPTPPTRRSLRGSAATGEQPAVTEQPTPTSTRGAAGSDQDARTTGVLPAVPPSDPATGQGSEQPSSAGSADPKAPLTPQWASVSQTGARAEVTAPESAEGPVTAPEPEGFTEHKTPLWLGIVMALVLLAVGAVLTLLVINLASDDDSGAASSWVQAWEEEAPR